MDALRKKINQILDNRIKKTFIQLISDLNNQDEIEVFLKDFLTPQEYDKLSKRLAIAYWLQNKRTVTNIKTNLKGSKKEIDMVKKISGKEGVKLALKKVEADEWAEKWSEKIKKFIK